MTQFNDMLAPPPIKLPEDLVPTPITESVVLAHPASPLAWATLAEEKIAAATTAPNDPEVQAVGLRLCPHRLSSQLGPAARQWLEGLGSGTVFASAESGRVACDRCAGPGIRDDWRPGRV